MAYNRSQNRYLRHNIFARVRKRRQLRAFLIAQGARLAASATSQVFTAAGTPSITATAHGYVDFEGPFNVAAQGVFTPSGNPANTNTITIGTRVYTFVTGTPSVDGQVKIGGTVALTLTNLVNAINKSGGTPGTDYFVSAADPIVGGTATTTATVMTVTSNTAASVATTVTVITGWGATTMSLPAGYLPLPQQYYIKRVDANTLKLVPSVAGGTFAPERAVATGLTFTAYTTNGTGQLRIIRDVSAAGIFGLLVDNRPVTIKASVNIQTLK